MKSGGLSDLWPNLFLSLGSIVVVLGLMEVGLRLLFPVSDIPSVAYESGVGLHLAPDQAGTWVVGATGEVQGHYRVNHAGWNSLHEFSQERPQNTLRIAVIGDSYVEALQVDTDKSFPAIVERTLRSNLACAHFQGIEAYSFGFSGAGLSQYLSMMRYAAKRYHPDAYVINIVSNDFDESLNDTPPHFLSFRANSQGGFEEVAPVPYKPPLVKRVLKKLAIARYAYVNLQAPAHLAELGASMKRQTEAFKVRAADSGMAATNRASESEMMAAFVKHLLREYWRVAHESGSPIVYVMDADRQALYEDRNPSQSFLEHSRYVTEAAAEVGASVMDLTAVFKKDYELHNKPFNSSVDGHWNKRGHEIVSSNVSQWISENLCQDRTRASRSKV